MSGSMLPRTLADELVTDLAGRAADPVSVVAPFTGEELYRLPHATPAEVQDAAARARAAQRAWRDAGDAHRRAVLLRAHDLLLDRRELLLDAVQTETGKTRGQAFEEVFNSAAAIRYAALSARRVLAGGRRRGGIPLVVRARVRVNPKGLVGVITPWNYPLVLGIMDVVPALATGNAIVQKADDQGALSVLLARRAFLDAGLPPELWAVVTGPGAEIGSAVVDAADYVCFTGSTATGRTVAQRAAGRLIGSSMELGGKNPLIVLDDVDVEKAAADAAYGCFSAAGQLCVSVERVYVERGIADRFVPAFADRVAGLAIGTSFDYTPDVGSLATRAQLERVTAHLDDALGKGATLLAGGHARPDLGPLVMEPTVLTDVTDDMACSTGETFGPLVAVTIVDSADDAIRASNASEYGLNASVMSGSRARARAVAARLEAGSVNIGEGYRATFGSIDAPMGGVKQSGLGRRNGREGLERFVQSTTIGETTGLMQLPRAGYEFGRLVGLMVVLLRTLKAVRRR
ncbi:succinic semialdehyde dehydrogenase [Homoserinibacter sp. GY 40078]|uniref:succinic semialdehyde dehydrogenase n=1 Tax=Homoserinibacter sp. GY 40078 TaxID=2603275 RepID=UPI0011C9F2F9|nr:succinic semialdehyde dehydrogenase [Homoserinibacter sp. GY 40078]TXK19607.1 aldehyde dehydrogenase family protein [Homoserinibacter sp. GY 40078]